LSELTEEKLEEKDWDLVRAHVSGDPEAFRKIYEKFHRKIFASSFRIIGEEEQAADLTSEVFLKIYNELRSFKFESKLSTWLFRVAVNHAINKANENRRHTRIREKIEKEGLRPKGGTREGKPIDEEIHRAIQVLSPKLRAIVSLRYLEGLSYDEMADLLDVSLGTVKSRLFLAHETLRPLLNGISLSRREEDHEL
tara:strand:- start:148 stop:735 length:588 start_codon:yes stop_codon:yes gene_type:complete